MTDENDIKALRNFFSSHISPLAEQTKTEQPNEDAGVSASPQSYFIKRHSAFMDSQEFELALGSRAEFAAALTEYWRDTRYAPLAPVLLEFGSRFEQIESKDGVSSFVYEMF